MEHAADRLDRSGGSFAVMFLDMDRFKPVNDVLGHPAGDQLLRTTATRLRSCLRSSDTAARLGGDEFGILLEDVKFSDEVVAIAERILSETHRPVRLGGTEITTSMSIGISHAQPGLTNGHLLSQADSAMYAAKLRGGNTYQVFSEELLPSPTGVERKVSPHSR